MMSKPIQPSLGTFRWHNAAQFAGALNDNLFKLLVIFALTAIWQGKTESEVISSVGAVFAIPFLLFLGAAGVLADRVPKFRIVRWIKTVEIGVMAFGTLALFLESRWMLLGAVFLMSTQSAFFSPSKFGIVPELVGRENISRANSLMQAATYLAMILGTVLAPSLSLLAGERYALVGMACVLIAVLGFAAARRIQETPCVGSDSTASVFFIKDLWHTLRFVHRDGFLTLAVWSAAYFLMIAAFVQFNLLVYGTQHLLMASQQHASFLFLFVALGIGAGSLLAGRVSRRSIEFGIVPVGALLLTLSCLGLFLIPEGSANLGVLCCFVMGVGAGLFIVPVQSFLQFRSPPDRMGEIIAASGWLSWVGVLLAVALLHLCSTVLGLSAAQSFLFLAGFIAIMTVVAFLALPDFFLRFVIMWITRAFYRVQSQGLSNLPAHGPALIVSNHVSLMDAVWLNAVQQRRIRFLMSKEYLADCGPWMTALLKLGGVVPIHEDDNPKAILQSLKEARRLLDDGWLVCIFAEGHLTRTGHLLPFKPGFERIVRKSEIPIVPVYIQGGYGSYASFAHGEPRLMHPEDFRHQVIVSFGPQLSADSKVAAVRRAVELQAAHCEEERKVFRRSAGRMFVDSARRNWKRKALADSSGKEFSYGRALTASLLLRTRLSEVLHADPDEVGVLLPPSVGGALVNLALTLDQRVAVNLNYTASTEAFSSAIQQTGMRTMITSRRVTENITGIPMPEQVVYVEDLLQGTSRASRLAALLKARLFPRRWLVDERLWSPDDPLTILFSSGSTAEPKGVVLSHHNVLTNIESYGTIARAQPDDNICGVLPFFHSFGYSATLWFPLLYGFSAAYHSHPLETDAIAELCTQHHSSIIVATPTFLTAYCRKIPPEAFASMRWVCVGAEKLRPKLATMFEKRFGVLPMEGYGATECAPVVALNIPDCEADGLKQRGHKAGSIGQPLPGICTRIVDPDSMEDLEQGKEGLLLVKGANVMKGYLNNPERTAEAMHDGWYITGDIAVVDEDGFISITDRLARFSKIGGEMVSHTAVEHAIQELLGCGTGQLAVTGMPDERKGERLVVILELSLGDVAEHAAAVRTSELPNLWKPAPRDWIPIEELPTLGSGKLDLGRLKDVVIAWNEG